MTYREILLLKPVNVVYFNEIQKALHTEQLEIFKPI